MLFLMPNQQCQTLNAHEQKTEKAGQVKAGGRKWHDLKMVKSKGKGFPYSIPSVGPGADPGVQAVSPQVTVSHPSGGRLPLLSARPAVTSPAAEHHRPFAGTKLYCLVTETHRCEQLAQGCCAALARVGFEPATYWLQVQRSTCCTTAPPTENEGVENTGGNSRGGNAGMQNRQTVISILLHALQRPQL